METRNSILPKAYPLVDLHPVETDLEHVMDSVDWMVDELQNHVYPAILFKAQELMHTLARVMQQRVLLVMP